MTNPTLTALLSTFEGIYREIPYDPLLQRLLEVTHGRVLRMDREMPQQPANVSADEWKQFEGKVRFDTKGLWIEYEV